MKVALGVGEEPRGGLVVVVMRRVAVAGTARWMGVLDCAEEVHCSSRSRRSDTHRGGHLEQEWGSFRAVRELLGYVVSRILQLEKRLDMFFNCILTVAGRRE